MRGPALYGLPLLVVRTLLPHFWHDSCPSYAMFAAVSHAPDAPGPDSRQVGTNHGAQEMASGKDVR
jgi:hypothetical protein